LAKIVHGPLDDAAAVVQMFVARSRENDFPGGNLIGHMHCSKCGEDRRMVVIVYHHPWKNVGVINRHDHDYHTPSLLSYICRECDVHYTAVLFTTQHGRELAVFPSIFGGVATPNTPAAIGYYLDQAHRAFSGGAKSASVAMYRAALEHLLFEQGFKVRQLGPKIIALEAAIAAGSAPPWAASLDPDVMKQINRLGNFSIHPNDGDISKQEEFTNDVLRTIRATFRYLLTVIYEETARRAALLGSLKAVAQPAPTTT